MSININAIVAPEITNFDGTFESIEHIRQAFKTFATASNLAYFIQKSDKTRFIAVCPSLNEENAAECAFRFSARMRKDDTVRASTKSLTHSLHCTSRKTATSASLVSVVAQSMQSFSTVRPRDIMNLVNDAGGSVVKYNVAWRAQKRVQQEQSFDDAQSFMRIHGFLQSFEESNPGSIVDFERSSTGIFVRAFICPVACLQAFSHCRPIIIVDACHIRSRFKGIAMSACVQDGVGNILPLAVAVADVENQTNWEYFLTHLRTAIPQINSANVVIMHDREKGLENARALTFPNARQSICMRHLVGNVLKRFKFRHCGLIWKAAKSYLHANYTWAMAKIDEKSSEVAQYFIDSDPSLWARSRFPVPRYGCTTSNSAESLNSWINDIRDGSYFNFFYNWTLKVSNLMFQRRTSYDDEPGVLPGAIIQRIRRLEQSSIRARIVEYQTGKFHVTFPSQQNSPGYVSNVDLVEKKCSCGGYQEERFPCEHVAAVTRLKQLDCVEIVDQVYHTRSLKAAYEGVVVPVIIGTVPSDESTIPISVTRTAGRPPIRRMRSEIEAITEGQNRCTNCNVIGHNSRTCRALPATVEAVIAAPEIPEPEPVVNQPRRSRTVTCRICGASHYRRTPCRT